jgi:hypothetical protein
LLNAGARERAGGVLIRGMVITALRDE